MNFDFKCANPEGCFIFLSPDFLGRTEVSLAKLVAKGNGPWHERLLLYEVESGEVVVRIELQLM